jgi:hypothetical protein
MRLRLSSALIGTLILVLCGLSAYTASAAEEQGSITGTVQYADTPPKPVQLDVSKDRDVCGAHPLYDQSLLVGPDRGIADAVVTIPSLKPRAALKPETVAFDQKGCEYMPHVAVFTAGSTVDVINSDGILHSIHTESTINPVLDMAQPGFKKTINIAIAKPEVIKVTCDAHNWMEGWWYVTSNPYYAITDAHGRYTLHDVPPGVYELQVWQEKLGVQKRPVTVKPSTSAIADFTLK